MSFDLSARASVFARLLLLQATWSFERMQGLGFAYALEPWLARVYPRPEELRAALARHSEYFNTQPYVASLIAGLVCALEQDAAALPADKRAAAYERLKLVKKAMGAALAGLGDSFFWGALRPAAAAAALAVGLYALRAGRWHAGAWTAFTYLLVYNAPALWLRWSGLRLGYEWREQLPAKLGAYTVRAWVRRVRLLGAAFALLLVALTIGQTPPSMRVVGGLAFGVFTALYVMIPDRVTALRLYGAGCVAGVVAAAAGWL